MVSKPKSSRARTSASRRRKPATIDLKAKEVPAKDSGKEDPKPSAGAADQQPKAAASAAKGSANKEPDKGAGAAGPAKKAFGRARGPGDSRPAAEPESKPVGAIPNVSDIPGSPIIAAMVGGLFVLIVLSVIGQFENARHIPVLGNIFGGVGEPQEVAALQARIEGLEARLEEAPRAPDGSAISALDDRIGNAENAVENISAALDGVAGKADLQVLEGRVDQLVADVQQLATSQTAGIETASITTAQEALIARLERLESQISEFPVGELEYAKQNSDRLDKLEQDVSGIVERPGIDISTLEERLSKAEQTLQALAEVSGENTQTLSSLAGKSETLESQITAAKASEKVARSVAVNSLGAALRNGDGLGIPLSSIEALTGVTPETERLRQLSRGEIADLSTLSKGLAAIQQKAESQQAGTESGGLMDRLLASTRKLYTIRPSGPVEGDEPAAVFSRIRAHLEKGELEAVLREFENLPEAIQQQGNEWIMLVSNRAEAFSLYQKLSSDLSGSTNGQ